MTSKEIENNFVPDKEILLNWDQLMSNAQSPGHHQLRSNDRTTAFMQNAFLDLQTASLYPNNSQLFSGSYDFNKLTDRDRQEIGLNSNQIDALRKDIASKAKDPLATIHEVAKGPRTRIIAMGETHEDSPHRALGAQMMHQLKQDGVAYLAIECPPDRLEPYLKSGDTSKLPSLLVTPQYLEMLEAAKKEGLKIVPVDPYLDHDRDPGVSRDFGMSQELGKLIDADPKHKVLFWVGEAHLDDEHTKGSKPEDGLMSAAEILKRKYGDQAIVTFMEQTRSIPENLVRITPDIKRASAVRVKDIPALSSLTLNSADPRNPTYKDYDYVLIYPEEKAGS